MKKILPFLLSLLFLLTLLTSCGAKIQGDYDDLPPDYESMFVLVEENIDRDYIIIYHRNTKVLYHLSTGYYNSGNLTVMLNPDGTPMLYDNVRN